MSEFVVMKNVKKTYKMGEVMIHAVDGVDIEIHKGEFAVIVGPSGAGMDQGRGGPGRQARLISAASPSSE